MLTLTTSLLYFSLRPASGNLSPDTHLHLTPTSMSSPSAVWNLVLSAILINAWWYTLKRTWDVGHPSLRSHSGCHFSLSSSFLLMWYAVVSWRSCFASRNFPSRSYLYNISHRAGLLTRGYACRRSKGRTSGSFLFSIQPINCFAALPFFLISTISSCILTIICVASTVDFPCLKPFWLPSSSCRGSAHHLKRVAKTRARIRLPMANITNPL